MSRKSNTHAYTAVTDSRTRTKRNAIKTRFISDGIRGRAPPFRTPERHSTHRHCQLHKLQTVPLTTHVGIAVRNFPTTRNRTGNSALSIWLLCTNSANATILKNSSGQTISDSIWNTVMPGHRGNGPIFLRMHVWRRSLNRDWGVSVRKMEWRLKIPMYLWRRIRLTKPWTSPRDVTSQRDVIFFLHIPVWEFSVPNNLRMVESSSNLSEFLKIRPFSSPFFRGGGRVLDHGMNGIVLFWFPLYLYFVIQRMWLSVESGLRFDHTSTTAWFWREREREKKAGNKIPPSGSHFGPPLFQDWYDTTSMKKWKFLREKNRNPIFYTYLPYNVSFIIFVDGSNQFMHYAHVYSRL